MSQTLSRPPQLRPLLESLRHTPLPRVAAETEHRLALAETVELKQLQSLAEREPGLALAILQAANARTGADDAPRGLQQGIHRLGSGGVQRLLRGLRAVRYDRTQPGHLLALRTMATSRLAWLYLAHWLRAALASDEDARLSSLILLDVARWKLPLAAPALAAQIEHRVESGERRARIERELLGADLDSINLWHLQDLGVPQANALVAGCRWTPTLLARTAAAARSDIRAQDLPPRLKGRLRERGLLCSLARALAQETQVDWYSTRTRHLLQAAATITGRPLDEVLRGVQRQAVFASREALFSEDAPAPAAGLLRPPRPPRSLRRGTHAPADSGVIVPTALDAAAAANASPANSQGLVAAFAQRCQLGHPDLRSLFTDSARLFTRLGLKRCALFLRETDQAALACYFSFGFPAGQASRSLRLPTGEPGLVKLLLARPGVAFRVARAQRAVIGDKLPAALADWAPDSGMLLATVAVQGRAVGFWWADSGPVGAEASAETFADFRRAVEAFGSAFTRQLARQSAHSQAALAAHATSQVYGQEKSEAS